MDSVIPRSSPFLSGMSFVNGLLWACSSRRPFTAPWGHSRTGVAANVIRGSSKTCEVEADKTGLRLTTGHGRLPTHPFPCNKVQLVAWSPEASKKRASLSRAIPTEGHRHTPWRPVRLRPQKAAPLTFAGLPRYPDNNCTKRPEVFQSSRRKVARLAAL